MQAPQDSPNSNALNVYAIVLEDDDTLANALSRAVSSMGYEVGIAHTLAAARKLVSERRPAVMLVDVTLPDGDGLQLMSEMDGPDRPSFIVITGDSSQKLAVQCIRAKAFDMLSKPIRLGDLKAVVGRALEAHEQIAQQRVADAGSGAVNLESPTIAIGSSAASRDLRTMIARAAAMQRVLCLVEGDTGVEKNAVAEAIHHQCRCPGRLITVNCAGEKDAQSHSRFFGVQGPGDADSHVPGYIEQAAGGTLVLDDITELSVDLQARLLGFIDSGHFMRTNGVTSLKARVGLLGIARRSVKDAIASGNLREDFYYRLAQCVVKVPRLHQRSEDKLEIAEHLLAGINERKATAYTLSAQAREVIESSIWPGNIQELKNTLHRACLDCDGSELTLEALSTASSSEGETQQINEFVGKTFWQIEKELLYATLDHHGGDKEKTAKTLGISLKTLYNRLHAYS